MGTKLFLEIKKCPNNVIKSMQPTTNNQVPETQINKQELQEITDYLKID